MIGGEVLNFFLSKDHKTTLTVSTGYHITLHITFCHIKGSLRVHKLTKLSTLLSVPVLASRLYTSTPLKTY